MAPASPSHGFAPLSHRRVLLAGADASCDLVVPDPTVSSRHCRLTQYEHGFTLEDLGSTNGTFVDGVRLPPRQPIPVTRRHRITLGPVALLPWPSESGEAGRAAQPGVIRIGRSPDSDVVIDYPMISWDHARIVEQSGRFVLEDLHSSNGTAINEVENRITRAPLQRGDDVYLGSFKDSRDPAAHHRRGSSWARRHSSPLPSRTIRW